MSLLDVSDLHARLGDKPVLNGASLRVEAGEFVGLIGPNGAGKTTLLRAILGLVPSQGKIVIDGKADLSAQARAKILSYLPQERDIAWPISVERIVSLGRVAHLSAFETLSVQDAEVIQAAMERMGVGEFANRPATELSGGEKARVLIARALAQQAPLMLADEPTAGLDPAHQIGLMRIFAKMATEGNSVVASLHDLGIAARWCTRLVLLENGRVVADGTPKDVLTQQRLRDVYHIETLLTEHDGRPIVYPLDLARD